MDLLSGHWSIGLHGSPKFSPQLPHNHCKVVTGHGGYKQLTTLKMAIEIVDLPMRNGYCLHSHVYQKVDGWNMLKPNQQTSLQVTTAYNTAVSNDDAVIIPILTIKTSHNNRKYVTLFATITIPEKEGNRWQSTWNKTYDNDICEIVYIPLASKPYKFVGCKLNKALGLAVIMLKILGLSQKKTGFSYKLSEFDIVLASNTSPTLLHHVS